MELSQTIEYYYVNKCDNVMNKLLSELAYFLVIIQPLMFHTIGLLRNNNVEDKKVFKVGMTIHIIWILFNLYSRFAYDSGSEDANIKWSWMYSNKTCIMRYNPTSHLYWQWTAKNLYDYHPNLFSYMSIWFIPPLFVKKERFTSILVISSFIVGTILTERWEEHASIWCFVSIPVTFALYFPFTMLRLKSRSKKIL